MQKSQNHMNFFTFHFDFDFSSINGFKATETQFKAELGDLF